MSLQCSKCPYVVTVSPGEKRPPWCPRCGADLKEAAPAPVPVAAPAIANSAAVPSSSHARSDMPVACEAPSTPPPVPLDALMASAPVDDVGVSPEGELFGPKPLWPAVGALCAIVCYGIAIIAARAVVDPPAGQPAQLGAYGVLGMFSIAGFIATYVTFRLCGQKFAVYPDHLVEWQRFQPTTIRWEQIRDVFELAHPAWKKYRIHLRGGRVLTITGETKNHERLGELIGARVAARRLPSVAEELAAGRTVRFGPLQVSQGGVQIDREFEPWHRIGVLTFAMNPTPIRGSSMVSNMIHVRIGSALVELGDIPNYRLFVELARRMYPASVAEQPA
jgi:Family of unknown function (DUF6585)